jgi:hypothetical protein
VFVALVHPLEVRISSVAAGPVELFLAAEFHHRESVSGSGGRQEAEFITARMRIDPKTNALLR